MPRALLKFRRLLEKHNLNEQLFAEVGRVLQGSGMTLKTGTIVDATLITAPSSTKNVEKKRNSEMHQTRKGQQWYFGMKLHIGVDSQSGLTHIAVVTPANVHDKHPLPDLLHGHELRVYGDSAYASQKDLILSKAPNAHNFTNCRTRKAGGEVDEVKRRKNRNKSKDKNPRRTRLCRDQTTVGFYQSTLPRLSQECRSRIYRAGIGEYLLISKSIDGTGAPIAGKWLAKNPRSSPKWQNKAS